MGFWETASTTGEDLTDVIKKAIGTYDLELSKCRGQAYDGAANMKGQHKGVQARIREIEPRALAVHCLSHSANLAMQDAARQVPAVRDALDLCHQLAMLVKDSPKRFHKFKELAGEDGQSIKPLCPTRWTVRLQSIQ